MRYVLSEESAIRLRDLLNQGPGASAAAMSGQSGRQVIFVRVTGSAVGGFYPCVPTQYLTDDDAWEDFEAGSVFGANEETLEEDTVYLAVRVGDDSAGNAVYVAVIPGGVITIEDDDGNPTYSGITTLQFDQSDGFAITNPSAGVAKIDFGIVVEDDDSNPTYSGITTLRFDQDDGFTISNPSSGVAKVDFAFTAMKRGKLDGSMSYQGSATMSVWYYNGSAEADTGDNITVYDWLLSSGQSIASGTQVVAQWDVASNRWYLTGAQCA